MKICCAECDISDLCKHKTTVLNLTDEVNNTAEDLDGTWGATFQVDFSVSCSRKVRGK